MNTIAERPILFSTPMVRAIENAIGLLKKAYDVWWHHPTPENARELASEVKNVEQWGIELRKDFYKEFGAVDRGQAGSPA